MESHPHVRVGRVSDATIVGDTDRGRLIRRAERDSERRLRVQAESDARRAKAAADQAAAAAAKASRSLKMGEKQAGGLKDGEVHMDGSV